MKVRLQVADAEGGGVEQAGPGLREAQTGTACVLERPIEQPSSRVVPQRGMVSERIRPGYSGISSIDFHGRPQIGVSFAVTQEKRQASLRAQG